MRALPGADEGQGRARRRLRQAQRHRRHRFTSWAGLEAHLTWWMREIADLRRHGTTGEEPRERFRRDEVHALRPLDGRPPFRQIRELVRRVQADCCIELDTNRYSVPWRLIGESVQVVVTGGGISVRHAGHEVAAHAETNGRQQRVIQPAHFQGIAGGPRPSPQSAPAALSAELLRPLCEYEQLLGGGF